MAILNSYVKSPEGMWIFICFGICFEAICHMFGWFGSTYPFASASAWIRGRDIKNVNELWHKQSADLFSSSISMLQDTKYLSYTIC